MKEIKISKGYVVLVDDEDYDSLIKWKWQAAVKKTGVYAQRKTRKKPHTIQMHRAIIGITDPNIIVDHRDHNPLNNQKINLRVGTKAQNGMNRNGANKNSTSKYLGVSWDSNRNKWRSNIRVDNKQVYLGRFSEEKEAALAYNKAAKIHFKDFATLNQI